MEWISTKDRLPEVNTTVIIRTKNDGRTRARRRINGEGKKNKNEWITGGTGEWRTGFKLYKKEVTHWMPLPPPPDSK